MVAARLAPAHAGRGTQVVWMIPRLDYSVAIPTLGGRDSLCHCVEAALGQIPGPCAVILANDGELDATGIEEICSARCIPAVVFGKETPGLAASISLLAQRCATEWILLLDDDIILDPGFMSAMVSQLEADPRLDAIAALGGIPRLEAASGNRTRFRRPLERLFLLGGGVEGQFLASGYCTDYGTGWRPVVPYDVEHVPGGLSLWRTDVLRAFGTDVFYAGYGYGVDKDLAYRVSRRWRLVCVPAAGAMHLRHTTGRTPPRELGAMKMRNRLHFMRETLKPGLLGRALFWYASAGDIVLLLAGAIGSRGGGAKRRFDEALGMLDAIRERWRGGVRRKP